MPASRHAILGTLCHRALLLSFQKPWKRVPRNNYLATHSILTEVRWNADLLVRTGSQCGFADPDSHFRSVVDSGGPFWSAVVDDFAGLSADDRRWVLRRVADAAVQAARLLIEDLAEEDYISLRSEVPLDRLDADLDPEAGAHDKRADLVAVTARGDVVLVDFKFTARALQWLGDWHEDNEEELLAQLGKARGLVRPGRSVRAYLCYVNWSNGTHEWKRVA